jgi:hypothetical protein
MAKCPFGFEKKKLGEQCACESYSGTARMHIVAKTRKQNKKIAVFIGFLLRQAKRPSPAHTTTYHPASSRQVTGF